MKLISSAKPKFNPVRSGSEPYALSFIPFCLSGTRYSCACQLVLSTLCIYQSVKPRVGMYRIPSPVLTLQEWWLNSASSKSVQGQCQVQRVQSKCYIISVLQELITGLRGLATTQLMIYEAECSEGQKVIQLNSVYRV